MTRYDQLLHALAAGDLESAKAFWRSKQWTDPERRRATRLLIAATTLRTEVLP
jgi:hypothetical protein